MRNFFLDHQVPFVQKCPKVEMVVSVEQKLSLPSFRILFRIRNLTKVPICLIITSLESIKHGGLVLEHFIAFYLAYVVVSLVMLLNFFYRVMQSFFFLQATC